jgi:hypothetical protein
MKTTIDIPDKLLREAMKITKASTKREAVISALEELRRREQAKKVIASFGTFKDFMTRKELRQMRGGRDRRHGKQWHGAR